MKIYLRLLLIVCFTALVQSSFAQEDDEAYYEKLLHETVKVEHPVYKPVVGIGFGTLNFYGNVHNSIRNPIVGTPGYKINVATFLDTKHYIKTDFSILFGTLTANQRSVTDTSMNLNFSSDIICFGIDVHYSFDNLIKQNSNKVKINPFVSLGIESMQFNSKTDLSTTYNGKETPYHYWTDGTIRDIPQSLSGVMQSHILQRDYNYETDLRSMNHGTYSQNTFAIPLEVGVDFTITDRINLRICEALHYTFTKNIDNMSFITGHPNSRNDMFTYSYVSLHFDLFSSPKTIQVQKLFAEVDNFDYAMFGDEDNDLVYDIYDKCPGTPFGVPVDSVGCPLDHDHDGVPDYLDKQPNTPAGAMVDDQGVEIKPQALANEVNGDAIDRKDVEAYLLLREAENRYKGKPSMPLPAKFKQIDLNGDGYISFDELLKAINDYFDFKSKLSAKDIYQLQDFFFNQ